MTKLFRIQDENGQDVLGGEVEEDNVYVETYGALRNGDKAPSQLGVGELCHKTYALNGQKATVYVVVRTA